MSGAFLRPEDGTGIVGIVGDNANNNAPQTVSTMKPQAKMRNSMIKLL
ncbi:MAG: hypothetical protein ACRC46_01290 [Thermoguttaceae bacterium]